MNSETARAVLLGLPKHDHQFSSISSDASLGNKNEKRTNPQYLEIWQSEKVNGVVMVSLCCC